MAHQTRIFERVSILTTLKQMHDITIITDSLDSNLPPYRKAKGVGREDGSLQGLLLCRFHRAVLRIALLGWRRQTHGRLGWLSLSCIHVIQGFGYGRNDG